MCSIFKLMSKDILSLESTFKYKLTYFWKKPVVKAKMQVLLGLIETFFAEAKSPFLNVLGHVGMIVQSLAEIAHLRPLLW